MRLVRYLPRGVWRKPVQQLLRRFAQYVHEKTQSQVLWFSRWGTKVSVTKFSRRSKRDYRLKKNFFFYFFFTNFGWTCTSGRVWAWQCWHMTTLFTSWRSAWPPGCTSSWDTMGRLHCPDRDSNALLYMHTKQPWWTDTWVCQEFGGSYQENQVVSANCMLLLIKADDD